MAEAEAAQVPPVEHPLVRRHPDGRVSLYVSATYMECVVGLADAAGRQLLEELMAWATQDCFTYRHRWRPDDVLMWDNRWLIPSITASSAGLCTALPLPAPSRLKVSVAPPRARTPARF